MAILHAFSSPIVDGTNTQLVRPSNWNDTHAFTLPEVIVIGGNTAGTTANISQGTVLLAGGNNITLSQQLNSITFSAFNQSVQPAVGSLNASSGTLTLVAGNLMSISNNVNTISIINLLTSGNVISRVSYANASGTDVSRYALEGHRHAGVWEAGVSNIGNVVGSTTVLPCQLVFAGGNNITLSQSTAVSNFITITISAFNQSAQLAVGSLNDSSGTLTISAGSLISVSNNASSILIHNLLSSSNIGRDVTTATNAGTLSSRFALADHAHRGVPCWHVVGTATIFFGSMHLSAGNLMAISSGGNTTDGSAQLINLLSSATTISGVASENVIGAMASRFALEGHQHAGIAQCQISGNTSNTSNIIQGSLVLAGGNNITLSQVTGAGIATITISAGAGGGGIAASAAGSSVSDGTVVWSNSNNITFGMNGSTITATAAVGSASTFAAGISTQGNTLGATGLVSQQMLFVGGNNITLSQSINGQSATLTVSAFNQTSPVVSNAIQGVGTANNSGTNTSRFAADDHVHGGVPVAGISGGNTSNTSGIYIGSFMLAGGNNITLSAATAAGGQTVTISAGAGGGGFTMSAYEPKQLFNVTATSSHGTSYLFNPMHLPNPLAFSKINIIKSFNIAMPALTSANSTYRCSWQMSHQVTIWKRSDYGANSKSLASVVAGSFGMSFDMSYNNSSHSCTVTWVTNSVGGTTTWSTASAGVNYSSYWTGLKFVQIPLVTTLTENEYWIAHRHTTAASASNSAFTMMSVSNLAHTHQITSVGGFSTAGSYTGLAPIYAGMGFGAASGTTNTMNASAITNNPPHYLYAQYINLPVTTTPN